MSPEKYRASIREFLATLGQGEDQYVGAFVRSARATELETAQRLLALVARLKATRGGLLRPTGENIRITNEIRRELRDELVKGRYTEAVAAFSLAFEAQAKVVSKFFRATLPDFTENDSLIKFLTKTAKEDTIASLLGAGLDERLVIPVRELITTNVQTGAPVKQLEQALRTFILGSPKQAGALERYTSQVVSDAITQFEANYIQAISTGLGLSYFLYEGTAIDTTRPFCRARFGKYFHIEEVKKWAAVSWAGKIPGTNERTIFTYRGGYNCRHLLIGVSDVVVPEAVKDRAVRAGFETVDA